MNHTSSTEIESIVQLVVERLLGSGSTDCNRSETPLQLTGKVITSLDVEGRLRGVNRIRIREDAIITPSVRDELVRWKVSIERTAIPNGEKLDPSKNTHQHVLDFRLTIIVSEVKSQPLRAVLPSCEFYVVNANQECSQVVQHLLAECASGHHWVWHTDQPYAASAAIGQRASRQLRSVMLVDLDELDAAFEQARPNLLIVDEKRWPSYRVSRLANRWSRLLRHT